MTGRTEEQTAAEAASHQLRTPLTAIRLVIEDLASWPEIPSVVGEQLEACLREVDRLSGAITSVLAAGAVRP